MRVIIRSLVVFAFCTLAISGHFIQGSQDRSDGRHGERNVIALGPGDVRPS